MLNACGGWGKPLTTNGACKFAGRGGSAGGARIEVPRALSRVATIGTSFLLSPHGNPTVFWGDVARSTSFYYSSPILILPNVLKGNF